MEVAIVGGGICGLSLALNLRQRGIAARIYERAGEIKPLGVGITLLPHAMREFTKLDLGDELLAAGIENRESCFFNRFGQLLYKEPRGKYAGYSYPEFGIHRGRLHLVLYKAALAAIGGGRLLTNRQCIGVEQDDRGVTLRLKDTTTGATLDPVRADVAIGCVRPVGVDPAFGTDMRAGLTANIAVHAAGTDMRAGLTANIAVHAACAAGAQAAAPKSAASADAGAGANASASANAGANAAA